MPSFADSAVIFILALMLFGPKKLPQLARQLGKLMAEFRRASNEFRMQMEDELRIEDQKEHQKKVDAMAGPPSDLPDPEHPHLPSTTADLTHEVSTRTHGDLSDGSNAVDEEATHLTAPTPIAESGSLRMMPPSTGFPVESRTHGTSRDNFEFHDADAIANHGTDDHSTIPEHTILPPVGMSSEEPTAEASRAEEQTHA
ncbi:MAG: Sec-independent protein translocase subunit TatA/TatB [Janthinobacterium lividum]